MIWQSQEASVSRAAEVTQLRATVDSLGALVQELAAPLEPTLPADTNSIPLAQDSAP
jgi:hypothetical protein